MQESINNQSMLKVGTILHGTYRIDSYLSSGGFGNTYVATNIEFDERVAIKEFFMKGVTQRDDNQTTVSVSNPENTNSFLEQKEKFKKEARRIRKLNNQHIIKVYDLFEDNGTAYYVMDYVDGENLAERLKQTGSAMTESEVCLILPQILDALKVVHQEGFCHLDIKPSNIMLGKDGIIRLIDFGASKQLGANGTLTTNAPTAFAQTPGYAPREQMEQNLEKIGPWTDIYALGATIYNLLTNKRPPLPTDIDDDISEDKHLALPMPGGVSLSMKKLILRMIKTNRLQRPQDIDAVVNSLHSTNRVTNQEEFKQYETAEDDEVTFISESEHKELKREVVPTEKTGGNSKEERRQKTRETILIENLELPQTLPNSASSKSIYILVLVCIAAISIGILFYIMTNDNLSTTQDPTTQVVEKIEHQKVKRMQYETAIGDCLYSGPVDENNKPHGRGEAKFDDGRYYCGGFNHGVLEGDQCYFKYDNEDCFLGEFRNNSFYQGKYTVSNDGSYYRGFYKNGQPSAGHWYDKNGKEISSNLISIESNSEAKVDAAQQKNVTAQKAQQEAEKMALEAKKSADRAQKAVDEAAKIRENIIASLAKASTLKEGEERQALRNNIINSLEQLTAKDSKNKTVYYEIIQRLSYRIVTSNSDQAKGHYNLLINKLKNIGQGRNHNVVM